MTRSIGRWKLPQPTDIKEDNEWIAIPRIARTIPFGYVQDDNDPDVLRPVPDELNLLEKARTYVNQYSYRQVANWISTQTGRYISHVGLRKRLENLDSVMTFLKRLETSLTRMNCDRVTMVFTCV